MVLTKTDAIPGPRFYGAEVTAMAAGLNGSGVYSGLAVTAQAVPNMTVQVASGLAMVVTTPINSAGNASVTITAADATYDRLDLIYLNTSGTIACQAGTVANATNTVPNPPAIPANSIILAEVYVAAAATSITNSNITDVRILIPRLLRVLYAGTSNSYTLPANTVRSVIVQGYATGSYGEPSGSSTKSTGTYYVTALGTNSATASLGSFTYTFNHSWNMSATAILQKDGCEAGGTISATASGVTHQYLIVLGY